MATTQPFPTLASRPAGLAGWLRCRVRRLIATLAERDRVARERHRLAELDDRQLSDIGLTRQQAARAARRHFWE